MSITDLIFSGSINKALFYFIVALVFTILLIMLDRFLFGILPNFLIGVSLLVTIGTLIYWLGGNFITNLWETNMGKAIITSIVLILLAIIVTSNFTKKKTKNIIYVSGQSINPNKIGKNIKHIYR